MIPCLTHTVTAATFLGHQHTTSVSSLGPAHFAQTDPKNNSAIGLTQHLPFTQSINKHLWASEDCNSLLQLSHALGKETQKEISHENAVLFMLYGRSRCYAISETRLQTQPAAHKEDFLKGVRPELSLKRWVRIVRQMGWEAGRKQTTIPGRGTASARAGENHHHRPGIIGEVQTTMESRVRLGLDHKGPQMHIMRVLAMSLIWLELLTGNETVAQWKLGLRMMSLAAEHTEDCGDRAGAVDWVGGFCSYLYPQLRPTWITILALWSPGLSLSFSHSKSDPRTPLPLACLFSRPWPSSSSTWLCSIS